MVYRDKSYCASPNCTNKCGRKMTALERREMQQEEIPACWAYFCGEPEKELFFYGDKELMAKQMSEMDD